MCGIYNDTISKWISLFGIDRGTNRRAVERKAEKWARSGFKNGIFIDTNETLISDLVSIMIPK